MWTFAVNYSVHIWNNTPRQDLNFKTPDEIFSGNTSHLSDADKREIMKTFHPFGCPVYVLDAKLQNGQKIEKWAPRTRTGVFLGHSSQHSSTVALILNPSTDRISPQYHCLFDDAFITLQSDSESTNVAHWEGAYKDSIKKEPLDFNFPEFEKETDSSKDKFADNFSNTEISDRDKAIPPNTINKSILKKRKSVPTKGPSKKTSSSQSKITGRAHSQSSSTSTAEPSLQREYTVQFSEDAGSSSSQTHSSESQSSRDESDLSNPPQDFSVRTRNTTKELRPVKSKKRSVHGKRYLVDSTSPREGAGNRKSTRSRKSRQAPERFRAALSKVQDLASRLQQAQKQN